MFVWRMSNAKNELLELATGNKWELPTFTLLPTLGDRAFLYSVQQSVEGELEPVEAQGSVLGNKKDAQKSAAAAMLIALAKLFLSRLIDQSIAPDYDLPMEEYAALEQKPCFVSALNMLCQGQGWKTPDYKRIPVMTGEQEAHVATYAIVTINGSKLHARTTKQLNKEARQEAAARLLVYLAAKGHIMQSSLPQPLQERMPLLLH